MGKRLLLLELNEVPFRVIDRYCALRPNSVLADMLKRSLEYETFCEDRLALDPWISWPSLHRGVNDESHNILHLGQALDVSDAKFPPIWKLLKGLGLRVGVFGSLHSSNYPYNANEYAFYLPDYFDNRTVAHPDSLVPFQELNLSMTRQSARNVSRKIPVGSALKFLASAPKLGVGMSTAFSVGVQLLRELISPATRIRRRAYQSVVMMDLFMKQLRLTKPDFACFYTNHVAAAMHRYWAAAFPEDYGSKPLDDQWVNRYRDEIWFAMDKLDEMLKLLRNFVDASRDYTLVVTGSMGQAAIAAEKTYDFLTIVDVEKFMYALGVPQGHWELRPAMIPCCCVIVDTTYVATALEHVQSLEIAGIRIVRDARPLGPASFDLREGGSFQFFVQFDSFSGDDEAVMLGKTYSLNELGLGLMDHEDGVNCTAQHVPEGAMFVYPAQRSDAKRGQIRERMSTLAFAPSVLNFFGFSPPDYMRRTPFIAFERVTG